MWIHACTTFKLFIFHVRVSEPKKCKGGPDLVLHSQNSEYFLDMFMFSSIFYLFSLLFLDQGQEVLKPKKVIVEPRRSAMASDNQRRKSLQEPNLRKFIEYCGREIAGAGGDSFNKLSEIVSFSSRA